MTLSILDTLVITIGNSLCYTDDTSSERDDGYSIRFGCSNWTIGLYRE